MYFDALAALSECALVLCTLLDIVEGTILMQKEAFAQVNAMDTSSDFAHIHTYIHLR